VFITESKEINMNGIHFFYFAAKPFDGDPRRAHQFSPFLQSQLGASKLSYILNVKHYPTPQPDEFLLIMEQQHLTSRQELIVKHRARQVNYDKIALPLYHHRLRSIDEDPEMSAVDKEISRNAIPTPVAPILEDQPSPFTPAMEIQLSKARDQTRQFDADADQALQLVPLQVEEKNIFDKIFFFILFIVCERV
jgi:hypothetical protein